jgi:hypothetical protein
MEKDKKEIDLHKDQMIREIKKIDKTKIFTEDKRNEKSIVKKFLQIIGYGKTR